MRNIAAFLLILCLSACKGNDSDPDNYLTATKNNADWRGNALMELDPAHNIFRIFAETSQHKSVSESISIQIEWKGVGTYILKEREIECNVSYQGDVRTGAYYLPPSRTAKLVITKYDAGTNMIEGNFEALLNKFYSNPDTEIDTFQFSGGKFAGKFSVRK